ncbi:MAG: UDP-N-acetylglucosamine 2-epimerase, partial [Promethearchaeia archaeon]
DNFLIRSHNFFKMINISKFILISLALFFKKRLLRRTKNTYHSIKNRKNTILFITDTKNQFYSIKPVYNGLLKYENINPKLYSCETFLELSKITKLFSYLLRIRKTISINKGKIANGLHYKTFNLCNILSIFYNYNLFIYLIKIFNIINNLIYFIGNNLPALVVIANDYSKRGRSEIGYFKLRNIPVVYIPHAGIPIMEELATNSEVSYITVSGEIENKYLMSKGEPKDKIIVTGRPRYQHFHKGKIQRLLKIRDIFDARKYEFNANKFTILLTTSPIDNKSNEKIITSVVSSLKELNLIDNLIIKLHPRENGIIHKKVLDKLEVNPIIVKDYDILELIASSNLLLSGISNTVLEAMIIGTPVVLLDFINVNFIFTSRYVFTEDKSLISVKDQNELTDILQKLIKNKDFYTKYSEDLKNLSEGYSFYDKTQNPTEKIINLFFKEINYNKTSSNY